jgi:UDP-3-O-[3-hydroxymyristoyl] glucosamine N-acyltransferase
MACLENRFQGYSDNMVRASVIAEFLGQKLHGPDVDIEKPRPISDRAPNSLLFAKKFRREWAAAINEADSSLALACPEYAGHLQVSHIIVPRPRLALARVLGRFFAPSPPAGIAPDAVVDPAARLGSDVAIGHYSVVGSGAVIGDGTVIANHVVIAPGARIGRRCLIKSHAVIGEEGFGIDFDETGRPVHVPHVGGVMLGDDVEVGAQCTIARGTLGDTVVEDDVKLDDHVHVAHNCRIGAGTVVTACAEISGSVQIGKRSWIGPNAAIINDVKIAEESLVGIGAVVVRANRRGQRLMGNPARPWGEEPVV